MENSKMKKNSIEKMENSLKPQKSNKFFQKVTLQIIFNYLIKQVKSYKLGNKNTILRIHEKYSSYNKENNSCLFNSQRLSSYNNYKNSTNDQTKKKLLSKEKINSSLIKKCKMTTIFSINNNNNSVSQSIDFNKYNILKMTNFSQFSKIKVNKIFSPYLEKKSNGTNNSIIIFYNYLQ